MFLTSMMGKIAELIAGKTFHFEHILFTSPHNEQCLVIWDIRWMDPAAAFFMAVVPFRHHSRPPR
jgi:hypothetical protein